MSCPKSATAPSGHCRHLLLQPEPAKHKAGRALPSQRAVTSGGLDPLTADSVCLHWRHADARHHGLVGAADPFRGRYIESHHNVGGLLDDLQFALVWLSRCARCSMTRCALSVPDSGCRNHWWRQPFLGSGLAVRIIGEVTAECLSVLREATPLRAKNSLRQVSTAMSGSARSCCLPPSALLVFRVTVVRTVTRSCCDRCHQKMQ